MNNSQVTEASVPGVFTTVPLRYERQCLQAQRFDRFVVIGIPGGQRNPAFVFVPVIQVRAASAKPVIAARRQPDQNQPTLVVKALDFAVDFHQPIPFQLVLFKRPAGSHFYTLRLPQKRGLKTLSNEGESTVPSYRIKGFSSLVHMKGTKLPAPCAAHILVDGRDEPCMVWSEFLCDGPASGRRGTCDRPLCEAHATQVGPNSHLCPSCRTEAIDEIGQRNLFTHLVQS